MGSLHSRWRNKAIKRDVKGRPPGLSTIGLAFVSNLERPWAYIFVFCIIPIIIRLDYHVQPHKTEL